MAERFNEILSRLRHEKGVSQKEAAAALGVSQALLSHYENAAREPGLLFLAQACDYYGVSADYILGRSKYRRKISLSAEALSETAPLIDSSIELMRAAFSLEDDEERRRVISLFSAMLYSFRAENNGTQADMTSALIALRRAQLSQTLSSCALSLPNELLRRTEEELSTLFNK